MSTVVRTDAVRTAPPAAQLRIPSSAEIQLSTALNWLARATRGRLSERVIASAMAHHRETRCEPAVLVGAAVQFLAMNCDREPDELNRYWHLADQISARERSRYLNTDEKDLL